MKNSIILFLELLNSALWDKDIDHSLDWRNADWDEIVNITKKQTVQGIVADGLVKLPLELRPPKSLFYNLIFKVESIEKKNKTMNVLSSKLIEKLNEQGCNCILQKGQGVASYYCHPEHRISGDIDLFVGFDEAQYDKANKFLGSVASAVGHNNKKRRHAEYVVEGIPVEIHGNIDTSICAKCDKLIGEWAKHRLSDGRVTLNLDGFDVVVASYNFDVLYVFLHFLNHYMNGGCGLRQLSDWMMYLDRNYEKINMDVLQQDIEYLGVMKFWKSFASLCVKYLGYPQAKMPFYDNKYDIRSNILLKHIFSTGNFGVKQKEKQLSGNANKVVKKVVTLMGQIPVYADNMRLFPKETFHCFTKFIKGGIEDV